LLKDIRGEYISWIIVHIMWPCGYILLLIRSEYKKNISVAMHLGVNNDFLYGSFEYVVITPNKYRIWYYDCQGQGHIILLYTILFISKLFISSLLLYTKIKYTYIVPTWLHILVKIHEIRVYCLSTIYGSFSFR